MREWLQATKDKPKHVRDRYAFYVAGLVTCVILVIWFAALPSKFAGIEVSTEEIVDDESGGFSRAWSDIKGQFANVVATLEEISPDDTTDAGSTVPPAATSTSPYELDIAALAERPNQKASSTASSTPVTTPSLDAQAPRRVLIATTSGAVMATSSTPEN